MPKKKQEPNWKEKAVQAVIKQGAQLRGSQRENVNPAKAAEMVADLVSLMSKSDFMDKWGLGGGDYYKFKNRYMPLITERKEWLARRNVQVAQVAQDLQLRKMEMLAEDEEELKKVNVRDLAMVSELATRGFTQLTEGNRMVIEHQKGTTLEEAAAMVAAARERARAKLVGASVEVVVEEPNNEQKQTN